MPNRSDEFPYYHLVPKELKPNIQFRRELLRLGSQSREYAHDLWVMCSRDLLFYINAFCFIFEPRTAEVLPFITFPFQDEALPTIKAAIGKHDLVIEKSRDMGATWMCLTTLEWLWHFHDNQTFLLLSRKEELVDKRGDPKSLFAKVDFLLDANHMPRWLVPNSDRRKLHRRNMDNGSTHDGESTNEFAGVADRRTALFLDEFSKMENQSTILRGTRDVTYSRIFTFTPEGATNAAFEISHNPDFRKLTLHWSRHPHKNPGLYTSRAGVVDRLDPDYDYPDDYEFVTTGTFFFGDGRFRSPWFDNECRRAQHPQEIAQELEIDYERSEHDFFLPETITKLIAETTRPPLRVETLQELGFDLPSLDGLENRVMRLWCPVVGAERRPAWDRKYVIGVDVSLGTGASNSCLSVWDAKTREKVAEYVDASTNETDLADIAVAVAGMFAGEDEGGAFLIWEANGPGRSFGNRVIKLGHRRIYWRRDERRIKRKVTDFPGWYATGGPAGSRVELLVEYRRALGRRDLLNRSKVALEECRQFIRQVDGSIIHRKTKQADNPGAARTGHGDIVFADALAGHVLRDIPQVKATETVGVAQPGTFAWRRQERVREALAASEW